MRKSQLTRKSFDLDGGHKSGARPNISEISRKQSLKKENSSERTKCEFALVVPVETTPSRGSQHPALKGISVSNTGINLHATLLVTKTLLIAGEGWGGGESYALTTKKTGTVPGEVKIPGVMGSMPMTYMVNGTQYIAFTVGTPTEPAEVIALAVEK